MIIKIKNLRAQTILGIHDWEKKQKRDIVINIEIEMDGRKPAISDDIKDTLDYDSLSQRIVSFAESTKTELIEKLTEDIIKLVMVDERVKRTTVEVDKPGAVPPAESISVTLTAERQAGKSVLVPEFEGEIGRAAASLKREQIASSHQ